MHSHIIMISFLVLIIVLTSYNFYTMKYSNKAIASLAFAGMVYRVFFAITEQSILIFLDGIVALVVSFVIIYFIFGLKQGAIGGGDAKLIMCIALIVGSIYAIIYCVISYIVLLSVKVLYSNHTYREGPNIASGFIWATGFVLLFVLNFYWDHLLSMLV